MRYLTEPWEFEGFPDRVGGDATGGVEKAYSVWLEAFKATNRTRAQRLQGDDVRYTAELPNAVFSDAQGGWQLMCDLEMYEPGLTSPGRVVFVDMGFAEGDPTRQF